MADNCILCGSKTGLFHKKTIDGAICAKCQHWFPPKIDWKSESKEHLEQIKKENEELAKDFDYTTSYGTLYIDAVHSKFLISQKENKNGEPLDFGEIFKVEDLTGVALYVSNIKNIGTNGVNKIVCDITFKVQTAKVANQYTISKQQNCSYKVNGTKIEWDEPADFQVFRSTFDNMLKREHEIWLRRLTDMSDIKEIVGKSGVNASWAKGVLFFAPEDEPSSDELKEHRAKLLKIFHPDNAKTGDTVITRAITTAFDMLSK